MEKKWLRLDNSAKIYPMILNKDHQNLFSMAADLYEEVDPIILKQALGDIMERFPSFNVKLIKGVFWYYFEQQSVKPDVYQESDIQFKKISFKNCKGFCFRVSYYRKRIKIEFFHVLCDGYGGTEFLKSLLCRYLYLKGNAVSGEQKILTIDTPPTNGEIEDSFLSYYKPLKFKELKVNELKGEKAFLINGMPFDNEGRGIIKATVDAKAMIDLCRTKSCTVTEFLGGLFMYSIYKCRLPQLSKNNTLSLFMPINLRKIFPSKTLRNFTLFARADAVADTENLSLDYFISEVARSLKRDTSKELLSAKISTTVVAEKLLPMRLMPLPLKFLIFKISNLFFGNNKKTATLSNVGKVDLPESMSGLVHNITFGLNANKFQPLNLAVASVFNKMTITFTRYFKDTEIECYMIRRLVAEGLDVSVVSNLWEQENAL